MSATLPKPSSASQREPLADVRPEMAKAELKTQVGASRLRDVAADAIRTVSGNARAASIDLGIHEGHLSRQLKDGTIRLEQLEVLGPAFAARFGQELVDRFAPLSTPAARALHAYEQALKHLDDVKQAVLFYATNDRF